MGPVSVFAHASSVPESWHAFCISINKANDFERLQGNLAHLLHNKVGTLFATRLLVDAQVIDFVVDFCRD